MTKESAANYARRGLLKGAVSSSGLLLSGFAPVARAQSQQPLRLRVGYQFGLVYAPVLLMAELGTTKRFAPDAQVEFTRVASGNVIRDQLISKRIDIGVLGPPPFLIGWQHLGWKYVCGTGVFPYKLVTWRPDIKSLKDFKADDKIAVPGLGSLQHILLAMAAKKQLGDARALDKNLIPLPHPDATVSMLSKNPSIAAHFANVPFLYSELDEPFIHTVLDGFDAFGGPFMSPLAFANSEFVERNPLAAAVFLAAYNEAVAMLTLQPEQAAQILAPHFKKEAKAMLRWLTWPGTTYTSLPYGIMGWHDFMLEAGYVKKVPTSLKDVCSTQLLAWIDMEFGGSKNAVEKLQQRG
jgi:NitT/TauT family transport system substrate-binding protein